MTQAEADLIDALERATASLKGTRRETQRLLSRGGIRYVEVDLNSQLFVGGGTLDLKAGNGYAIRFLRHGSNPGARLELSFGGNLATKFWAPGQVVRGGFDNVQLKRALGGAAVGKAAFAIIDDPGADLEEDLIISALGPVDLLGSTLLDGSFGAWVTVGEDTVPDGSIYFDGSGWELLRVFVKSSGATLESCEVHFFCAPSEVDMGAGRIAHATVDGVFEIANTAGAGIDYRVFTVPWSGRGLGAIMVTDLLPVGLTGLDFIIQGIR
jgi:hypothetical protein